MRRRLSFLGFALPVLVLVGLFAARPAFAQARVGGTVLDENGKPIKGASVTAENSNIGQTFTASTDDKGRFTMIGLRPGQWKFIAAAPGYMAEAGTVPLRTGNNANPPVTIALKKSGALMGPLGNVAAKDLQAQLTAADALFNQKKFDEAIAAYKAIQSKAPSLTTINLQIAAAQRGKSDYEGAIATYRTVLQGDADNEKAKIGIALANAEKGDLSAAEDMLVKASESPTAGRETFYNLADVKVSKGQPDEAMKWYQKASAADPSWGKPLYKLGMNAVQKGDKAAATDFLTRAIVVDPVSPEAALAKTAIDQLNK